MKGGVPRICKYYHQALSILLFLFYAPIIYSVSTATMSHGSSMHGIQLLLVFIDVDCDVTINILLLFFYIRGLHMFSKKHLALMP